VYNDGNLFLLHTIRTKGLALMSTSRTGFLAEILSGGSMPVTGEPIPAGQRAYFQERLKGRIFSFIVGAFLKQQRDDPKITQAAIARRLERRPEQINRWLAGPSNMTLETISDLVLAICGGEPSIAVAPLRSTVQSETPALSTQTLNDLASSGPQGGTLTPLQNEAGIQGGGFGSEALAAEGILDGLQEKPVEYINSGASIYEQAVASSPMQTTQASADWERHAFGNAANNNALQSAQPLQVMQG
jgi:hypothetical protein